MAAKPTRLTHKIAIQLHFVADSCTTCSSHSGRPVRKLLDTLSCVSLVVHLNDMVQSGVCVCVCSSTYGA